MDWERGDITAFLSLFPAMCMYVASSHKTKVPKAFLMLAERLRLYKNKHPNVIRLFSANCIQLDEEKIEFMNAKIGRWMKARIKDLSISHYIRVTSIMKCIQNITQSFSKLFNRKEQENENKDFGRCTQSHGGTRLTQNYVFGSVNNSPNRSLVNLTTSYGHVKIHSSSA